jgi:GNAT superfamily N-acetyltransferase
LPELLVFEQAVITAERQFNDEIKDDPVRYYDIAKLIVGTKSRVLVAQDGAQLIGTGHASLRKSDDQFNHDRHAYLGLMFVAPTHRGQGVIQQIMDGLLAWARGEGVKDFYLDVYADNMSALKAYERYGFTGNLLEMRLSDYT